MYTELEAFFYLTEKLIGCEVLLVMHAHGTETVRTLHHSSLEGNWKEP